MKDNKDAQLIASSLNAYLDYNASLVSCLSISSLLCLHNHRHIWLHSQLAESYTASYNDIVNLAYLVSYSYTQLCLLSLLLWLPIQSFACLYIPIVYYAYLMFQLCIIMTVFCIAYSQCLHCVANQPPCSLLQLTYSVSALHAYPCSLLCLSGLLSLLFMFLCTFLLVSVTKKVTVWFVPDPHLPLNLKQYSWLVSNSHLSC